MELLKFLFASVFALCMIPTGAVLLRGMKNQSGSTTRLGLSGLIGMAAWGTVLGLLFLLPGAITRGVLIVVLFGSITPAILVVKFKFFQSSPSSEKMNLFWLLGFLILILLPLAGVLTPSTSLDWDSIAYHLAVPKLWVAQGHAGPISYIHHSNFPGAVDSWFTVGELIGGQTAAKTFTWWFTIYGCLAIFGFIRDRFNATSAWLCTIAFASIPMVMWESGTAYLDVANGLFAGFGFVFAAQYVEKKEKADLILAAILLSFAAGSKYTGLQAIFIASAVVLFLIDRQEKIGAVKLGGMAIGLSSFWYIKNWILVGNPVYPFFYGAFGGKNWDAFQSQIYTNQQKTFGYAGPMNFGQSLLGLVTSPGRFTDPQPTFGGGFAFVSLGFIVVAGAIVGIVKGLVSKFDRALALMILLQLVAWFALSQQSRYILTLVVPMLVFFAYALEWKPMSKLITAGLALQVVASIWIYQKEFLDERLMVLTGALTREEFLGGFNYENGTHAPGHVEFYLPAKAIDSDQRISKVGLFDEVFGYYLDKPYFWATPGHTTELDYAHITTADEFIANMKKLGISHAYLTNKYIMHTDEEPLFYHAAGIQDDGTIGVATPYPADERSKRMADEQSKWRVLFAEAVAAKKLTLVTAFSRTRFLFKIE